MTRPATAYKRCAAGKYYIIKPLAQGTGTTTMNKQIKPLKNWDYVVLNSKRELDLIVKPYAQKYGLTWSGGSNPSKRFNKKAGRVLVTYVNGVLYLTDRNSVVRIPDRKLEDFIQGMRKVTTLTYRVPAVHYSLLATIKADRVYINGTVLTVENMEEMIKLVRRVRRRVKK